MYRRFVLKGTTVTVTLPQHQRRHWTEQQQYPPISLCRKMHPSRCTQVHFGLKRENSIVRGVVYGWPWQENNLEVNNSRLLIASQPAAAFEEGEVGGGGLNEGGQVVLHSENGS